MKHSLGTFLSVEWIYLEGSTFIDRGGMKI